MNPHAFPRSPVVASRGHGIALLIGCLGIVLGCGWFIPSRADGASSCETTVRLEALMISSNRNAVGFPPLLSNHQNPTIFFGKKVDTGFAINTSCYICHERGSRVTSDFWEYNPITGEGPSLTVWSGSVSYHSETNGTVAFDCHSTRTGPTEWSDPTCGFSLPSPSDVVVSNRTATLFTLVQAREIHELAPTPRGSAVLDISEQKRVQIEMYDALTLDSFIAEVSAGLAAAPWPDWSRASRYGFAERGGRNVITVVNDDRAEFNATLTRLKYRIAVRTAKDQKRTVTWLERFTPNGGGSVVDTSFSEEIVGTGREQFLTRAGGREGKVVEPPASTGKLEVLLLADWSCDDDACAPGRGTVSTGSIDVKMNLGRTAQGESAGFLALHEELPAPDLANPTRLQHFTHPNVEILRDGHQLRQINAPQTLAIVVPLEDGYEVRFHPATTQRDANGYYLATGSPDSTWRVTSPDRDPARLRVTQESDGPPLTSDFEWSAADQAWALVVGNYRKESRSSRLEQGRRIEEYVIRVIVDRPVYRESRTWQPGEGVVADLLLTEQIGAAENGLVTSWTYYDDPEDDPTFLQVRTVTYPGGAQEFYEYDPAGRLRYLTSDFAEMAGGRVIEYSYSPVDPLDDGALESDTPRTTIEWVLGKEVRRSYRSFRPQETLDIQCQRPGAAWAAPDNLITISYAVAVAGFDGVLETISYPDGTLQVSRQPSVQPGRPRLHWVAIGAPNEDQTEVVDGTRMETAFDGAGRILSESSYDVLSGTLLSREQYAYSDPFGRPSQITHLDGSLSLFFYDCCHLQSSVDREGVLTAYTHDPLGRVSSVSRNGLTELYTYNAADQPIRTQRQGSDGSLMTVREVTYDLAGRAIQFSDGLSNVLTTLVESRGADAGTLHTVIYPDGGRQIEALAPDGTLIKVSGNAAYPARYPHGVEEFNGIPRLFTQEIRGDANGDDTEEWVKSYTDLLGRPWRTLRSDGAVAEWFYNDVGQLRKQRDFDGRVTLYAYNARGEPEFVAIDVDNSDTIDLGGTDRVTRTVTDVFNGAQRVRTYVWPTAGSALPQLIATKETSLQESFVAETRFGLTTSLRNQVLGNGRRRLIATASDHSSTVSDYHSGRLRSVTRSGAGGESLGRTEFSYDPHGRVQSIRDGRSGLLLLREYDAADRVTQETRYRSEDDVNLVTRFIRDGRGRVIRTLYPNGVVRTNEYTETGQLRRAFGAKGVPMELDYDAQGRTIALRTWTAAGKATTHWRYAPSTGTLAEKIFSDGSGPVFFHTPEGALEEQLSARGVSSVYHYNPAGDLESLLRSLPGQDVRYLEIDRLGRPGRVQFATNNTALAYHQSGRLVSETFHDLRLTNVLNTWLQPAVISLFAPGSDSPWLSQTLSYDGASRLKTIRAGPLQITYDYHPDSSLIGEVRFRHNGELRLMIDHRYDAFPQLTRIGSLPSDGSQIGFDYQFDRAGRCTNVVAADGSRWAYRYNSLGQLVSAKRFWRESVLVAGQQFEYTFDPSGNRTSVRRGGDQAGAGLQRATYSVGLLNQYSQRDVPRFVDLFGEAPAEALVTLNGQRATRQSNYFHVALPLNLGSATDLKVIAQALLLNHAWSKTGQVFLPQHPESFSHDADGNLLRDGRWTYTWDAENRLIELEAHADLPETVRRKIHYTYDHQGRCLARACWRWDTTSQQYELFRQQKFVYDGWRLLAELNETNGLVRSYLWGVDLGGSREAAAGVGGLVAMRDHLSGTACFYVPDGQGNIRALIDAASGAVVARYDYGPFGELLRATGPNAPENPFRFSSKYQDPDSGLIYFGRRWYQPDTGRWISRDPLEEAGGVNLYAFVGNQPVDYIDPLGLKAAATVSGTDHGTVERLKRNGCCFIFTIKVDASGYRWHSPTALVKSMDRNRSGIVGHSWVRLENVATGYQVEGGHTGETQQPGRNPRITDPSFLTYQGGLMTLMGLNRNDPSPLPQVPEADPANPIHWLHYIYEDGHWADGSGSHTKVTSECSWCINASEFRSAKNAIERLRAGEGAALRAYGLTGRQCTSTAAELAASAGIQLNPTVTLHFPSVLHVGQHQLRLWTDPSYRTVRFGLPDKMGKVIESWSGPKQKVCK